MPYTPPPPPPPPTSSGSQRYIGVPDDWTTDQTRVELNPAKLITGAKPIQQQAMTPRYVSGAEYDPARLSAEKIARLQALLASAGFIGPKTTYRLGVWDDTSRNAYRDLLAFANQQGLDETDALDLYARSETVKGTAQAGELPSVRLSNPDDLREIADAVTRSTLGRRADAGFVDRFVAAYQAAERNEAQAGALGGEFTAAPDPRTLAEDMARQADPNAAAEYEAIQTSNEFFQLLSDTGLSS